MSTTTNETPRGDGRRSGTRPVGPDPAATAREPKHEKLHRALLALVEASAPHDPLPSERELMQRHDVSRVTVRRAVERLGQEGRIYRVQGSGTFVADRETISKSLRLTSFSEDIRTRRMTPAGRLLLMERVPADVVNARHLFVEPGAPLVHLERLRTADGEPMCLENVWLPESLVPGLLEQGGPTSLYTWLERAGAAPESAEQTVRATLVDAVQAALLKVPPHFPALHVERVTRDARGRAVERAVSLYRADRYDFTFTITRERRP
ncbi:GntR family transcriptional regulator [Kitasatospora indigofera]|uniref:GntR family transcriptional regulator n=1 Tax=Kitasatospora indigofera TaxID=67307 RepID=UPI00364B95BE